MVEHFGYRIRCHKLTEPGEEVDRDLMQRAFNTWLRKEGALSARTRKVEYDYDRKFVMVESKIGNVIDEGLDWLREGENGKFEPLYEIVMEKFDYLSRSRLLEALKAREAVAYIKAQHALGRKVIVFYDFNEGGSFQAFHVGDGSKKSGVQYTVNDEGKIRYTDIIMVGESDDPLVSRSQEGKQPGLITLHDLVRDFRTARPDLVNLDTTAPSPLQTLRAAFPQATEFNGLAPAKRRTESVNAFNSDDTPGSNLILAQKATSAG